jgi:ribosome-associated protein
LVLDSKLAISIACNAAENKQAIDIKVLDIKDISPIADYFIICSGNSSTQVKAIADEIEDKLTESGFPISHREGYDTARWILLDFGDIIIHVFHNEDREFYDIERLWADAEVVNF